MVAWRIATCWLTLLAAAVPAARAGPPRERVVDGGDVEVLLEPDDSAYATAALHPGERVVVLGEEGVWARIEPPAGTFEWVDAALLRDQPDGTIAVRAATRARAGAAGARMPGPPGRALARGDAVAPVDRPDLVTGSGDQARTWRAVRPGPDEARYVPLDALKDAAAEPAAPRPTACAERLASFRPGPAEPAEPAEPGLPAEVNAELTSIAAATRAVRAEAVESWDFGAIRGRYESLLRQFGEDPRVQAAVGRRLDAVGRDAELASKARAVADLLHQGAGRDAEVERIGRGAAVARGRSDRQYDAQGTLQASSRWYRGQRVMALIGPEGKPVSFVTLPPGVPAGRYLARRVGVRGVVHFDEGLGARMISVRDLELIEKRR